MSSAKVNATNSTSTAAGAAEETAIKICTSVNWSSVIQSALPVIERYGAKLLSGTGSGLQAVFKSLGKVGNSLTGSCTNCIPCSGSGSTPGSKTGTSTGTGTDTKSTTDKDTTDEDDFIDYPNPFTNQYLESTTATSSKRISAAFKRRLSRSSAKPRIPVKNSVTPTVAAAVNKKNRASAIYHPSAFDVNFPLSA